MQPKMRRRMKGMMRGKEIERIFPRLKFQRIITKTALLNLGIVLSVLPFALLHAADLRVLPWVLLVLTGVSFGVWILTFAISGLVLATDILCEQMIGEREPTPAWSRNDEGIADEWLDDPTWASHNHG